jgi:hypothetical protein
MPALISFDTKTTKAIIRAYSGKEQATLAELADANGVSLTVIRRVLEENNVEIRPRGRRPGQ